MNIKNLLLILLFITPKLFTGCGQNEYEELPNILWITSEDNGRFLGCYGDNFATTPNLDRLASEGFLYTNAYANAPVCAPARNTIITGVHACSNGHEQMRSNYARSQEVNFYTHYLRSKGYYCTNNSKTDYNTSSVDLDEIWDECSNTAHYRNRADGQPFFAIFNSTISHESSIHKSIPSDSLRHDPEDVVLPPYHPDTPELRHDWAQYYDKIEDMDARMGEVLEELEREGLAENTIVFYYADHAGVLGRSKRFLYESGTHVPFIIRIPKKYKKLYPDATPGSRVDRLISFVDLAPTLLSLTGTEAPEYMQGNAFLGEYTKEEPEYVYMFRDRMDERYDMSRSITDGQYRYTRNYNPTRIYLQHLDYLWRAPSMGSWEEEFRAGRCNEVQSRWWLPKPVEELYDTDIDPWEVNNLAMDPAYAGQLARMREASIRMAGSIRDAGFIPEAERSIRAGEIPIYDMMRNETLPFEEIQNTAMKATEKDPANIDLLLSLLDHDDSAIRYWAAMGLLLLGEEAMPHTGRIAEAALDDSPDVSVVAAETLYLLGQRDKAVPAYRRVLQCEYPMARTRALNSIDHVNAPKEMFVNDCVEILKGTGEATAQPYNSRAIKGLFEKWDVDPADYGLAVNW